MPSHVLKQYLSRLRDRFLSEINLGQYLYEPARRVYHTIPLPYLVRTRLAPKIKRYLSATGHEHYSVWIARHDTLNSCDRDAIKAHIATWRNPPLISVIMPVYKPNPSFLRDAIESIRTQLYSNWELCIADDRSDDATISHILTTYANSDHRIKVTFRAENGHISAASNSALQLATGEFVAFVDHDDLIPEHALYMISLYIQQHHGNVDILYSDEDKIGYDGQRYDPYFKPDWNRYQIYGQNYVAHLGVYRKSLVDAVNGFRIGYEGSQDYDLLLRILDCINDDRIVHVPFILYHWRNFHGNRTFSALNHDKSDESAYCSLLDHFARNSETVSLTQITSVKGSWDPDFRMEEAPHVSIIIPAKDKIHLLKECMDGLINRTNYPCFEVIIIDNNSVEKETFAFYEYLTNAQLRFRCHIEYDKCEFNYSRLNNVAVKYAKGDVIAFLNNDIGIINADWLWRLVSIARRSDVGAVGPKLLYRNRALQHAGVTLGIYGVASHLFRGSAAHQNVYFGHPLLIREVAAVTGACLVLKKNIFTKIGGFDENRFPISYNDVDLCLRLRSMNWKNVYIPSVELYHYESMSRGRDDTYGKIVSHRTASRNMVLKYGSILRHDPFYNENLALDSEHVKLAFPPRVTKPWRNWIELVVPFHRGDVLLAIQVACHAESIGVRVRLHVAKEYEELVSAFKPQFAVEMLECGVPTPSEAMAVARRVIYSIENRKDYSGRLASLHSGIDFKTNGLDIVERLFNEMDVPIDSLMENVYPDGYQEVSVDQRVTKQVILLHATGGWNLKSLPDFFVEDVVEYCHSYGYDVIQIGGPKDKRIPMCDGELVGEFSVSKWARMLEKSAGVICVDSWIAHLSAIIDVNHIVIYGPTRSVYTNSRRHFMKKRAKAFIIESKMECSPCDSVRCMKFSDKHCRSFAMIDKAELGQFIESCQNRM